MPGGKSIWIAECRRYCRYRLISPPLHPIFIRSKI
ncbi:MAG: hypothetical protein ACLRXQ_07905 [Phascolarctobacterium faecium]